MGVLFLGFCFLSGFLGSVMVVLPVVLAFHLVCSQGMPVGVRDTVVVGKNGQEGMICGIHRSRGQEGKEIGCR